MCSFFYSAGVSTAITMTRSATETWSRSFERSFSKYSEKGCTQTCQSVNDSPSAFFWRWKQIIVDDNTNQTVAAIDTCATMCLYSPDAKPLCPPGRCAPDPVNRRCDFCLSGTFENPILDAAASAPTGVTSGSATLFEQVPMGMYVTIGMLLAHHLLL